MQSEQGGRHRAHTTYQMFYIHHSIWSLQKASDCQLHIQMKQLSLWKVKKPDNKVAAPELKIFLIAKAHALPLHPISKEGSQR